MENLVLIRHGESTWNQENRFTGWTDVPLADSGRLEAIEAAQVLKNEKFEFDVVFTSVLKRAVCTCWTVLEGIDQCYLPVKGTWRLNERHYGALQGLNKAEVASKHGEDQVKIWRRSYNVPPPALEISDERFPGNQKMYKQYLAKDVCPRTESLELCVARVLPFWYDEIAPALMAGFRVLVVAHGNSLRGLVKHLDNMSEAEILELNIPTGIPLVYRLDKDLKPVSKRYLISEAELKAKMDAVANQGKKQT